MGLLSYGWYFLCYFVWILLNFCADYGANNFSFKKLDIHYSKNVGYTFKIRYYLPNFHEKKTLVISSLV